LTNARKSIPFFANSWTFVAVLIRPRRLAFRVGEEERKEKSSELSPHAETAEEYATAKHPQEISAPLLN